MAVCLFLAGGGAHSIWASGEEKGAEGARWLRACVCLAMEEDGRGEGGWQRRALDLGEGGRRMERDGCVPVSGWRRKEVGEGKDDGGGAHSI